MRSLTLIFLMCAPAAVLGHAYLEFPRSRNFGFDAANGGGTYFVWERISAGNWSFPDMYPSEGTHGLCGGTYSTDYTFVDIAEQELMVPTSPEVTYTEGDVIELQTRVTVTHGGYAEIRICDYTLDQSLDSQAAGQWCLDQNLLERLDPFDERRGGACGTPDAPVSPLVDPDCAMVDANYPSRFYFPDYNQMTVNEASGNWYFKMKFVLPADLSCTACTLQWYWHTAESCNPPGLVQYFDALHEAWPGDTEVAKWKAWSQYDCSSTPASPAETAEQYWNCADIVIEPKPEPPALIEGGACEAGEKSIPMYGNCTGQNSACCGEGLVCYTLNDEYSQCRAPNSCPCSWDCGLVPRPCEAVVPLYGNCHGSRGCCAEGLVCYEQDNTYAQCLHPGDCPECNAWSCKELVHGMDLLDLIAV